MDLCLSCKGCKSECPSNVDMGKLKQEWQYQYYKTHGVPLRSRLIGNFAWGMKLASKVPWAYKATFGIPGLSSIAKATIGFAQKRSMPEISKKTWEKWFKSEFKLSAGSKKKTIYLFIDELINYNEASIGIKATELLDALGYEIIHLPHKESGRSFLSKGLLKEAKNLAEYNVELFSEKVSEAAPLIGVEPSAILTFRDEYPDLLRDDDQQKARDLASNTFLIEEFLAAELTKKNIDLSLFESSTGLIKLHGHCQQKALSSMTPVKKVLTELTGKEVHMIPSGCCGMAGSFGYEREHYELSMQVGELVLLPAVREQPDEVIIAAGGTSCRHQIKDGANRKALHPVEILWEALKK